MTKRSQLTYTLDNPDLPVWMKFEFRQTATAADQSIKRGTPCSNATRRKRGA